MEGEKSSGIEVGPQISIGVCHKCHQVIPGSPIVKGNERFWNCKRCKSVTTTRFGTVLYKSNIARIANAVQVTICLLVSTSVY